MDVWHQSSFRWHRNEDSGHGKLQRWQSVSGTHTETSEWAAFNVASSLNDSDTPITVSYVYKWINVVPLGGCLVCITGWKEEQDREYASLVAAVLASCFLKDSGRPLFKNSLRALNCSSSWEFSEPSRLLSSKIDTTANGLRALLSWLNGATLEPVGRNVEPLVSFTIEFTTKNAKKYMRI